MRGATRPGNRTPTLTPESLTLLSTLSLLSEGEGKP